LAPEMRLNSRLLATLGIVLHIWRAEMIGDSVVHDAAAHIRHEAREPPEDAEARSVELFEFSIAVHPDHRTTVLVAALVTQQAAN